MAEANGGVLPYRVNPGDLVRWVNARARGRTAAQIRELGLPTKTLEGLSATAGALGWVDPETGELTAEGERFALGTDGERREAVRAALLRFPPYRRLLSAIAARPERTVTDAQWIETWWATNGYGGSQSNRAEGAAAFGRLVEWAGWGRYVPGRRGHPTRVEWDATALREVERRIGGAPAPANGGRPVFTAEPGPRPPAATPQPAPAVPASPPATPPLGEYNRVTVPLERGQVARLEVPHRLSAAEKRRLLSLLDLLIREEG